MSDRADWLKRLDPYAALYQDLYSGLRELIEAATDEELAQLRRDCRQPGQTNCGWTAHAIAPILDEEIQREQYARARRAEAGA